MMETQKESKVTIDGNDISIEEFTKIQEEHQKQGKKLVKITENNYKTLNKLYG